MGIENLFIVSLVLVMIVGFYLAIMLTEIKSLYITIPVTLILCVSMIFTIKQIQSLPVDGKPSGEFQVLSHATDGDTIFMWASPDYVNYPKTYRFPYTKEDMEQLQEAKRQREEGVPTFMKVEPGSQNNGGALTIIGSPKSINQDRTSRKDYEI